MVHSQIWELAFRVASKRDVIFFRTGDKDSRGVSMSLFSPELREDFGQRFFILGRDDKNGNAGIEFQPGAQGPGIQQPDSLKLVCDAPRRLFAIIAHDVEVWCGDFNPSFRLIGGYRAAMHTIRQ